MKQLGSRSKFEAGKGTLFMPAHTKSFLFFIIYSKSQILDIIFAFVFLYLNTLNKFHSASLTLCSDALVFLFDSYINRST